MSFSKILISLGTEHFVYNPLVKLYNKERGRLVLRCVLCAVKRLMRGCNM